MASDTRLARLRARPLPEWFRPARLGVFVHWTPASVPAFAPLSEDPFTLAEREGWAAAFARTPYVEWYENSLAIPGSPVAEHHAATYGDRPYEAFGPDWVAANAGWRASEWAELFAESGASYVVLVTKHHDGFCLWPTRTANPVLRGWAHPRDLVAELADAVRARGMRFGVYYSGGLDWTFVGPRTGHVIDSFEAMLAGVPDLAEYAAYASAHWEELIEAVRPDVLWNDIAHPRAADPYELIEWYYARVPDGVVCDRFDLRGVRRGDGHADFTTPEYRSRPYRDDLKFEVCRGIGRSFGYNALEGEADYASVEELCALLGSVAERGGNLLLNVGPRADGSIPDAQAERLLAGTVVAGENCPLIGHEVRRSVGA